MIISRKGGPYPFTKLFYHCALRMDITLIPGSNENIIRYILYITLYRIL